MTWREPGRAAPPCERCLLPMLPRGRVRALARHPPAEVESDVWFCPLCGTEHARPVWCRPPAPRPPPAEEGRRERLWKEYLDDPGTDVWGEP